MRSGRLASSALAIAGISFTVVAASTATAVAAAAAAADLPTRTASPATPSVKTPVSAEITLITGDQVQIATATVARRSPPSRLIAVPAPLR